MNILVITPYLPYPLSSGGAQGVFNMIENLRHKHHYTMVINEGGLNNQEYRRELQEKWPDVDIIYYSFAKQLQNPCFVYEKARRVLLRKLMPDSRRLMIEMNLRPYGEWFSKGHVAFMNRIIRKKNIDLVQVEFMEALPWVNHLPKDIRKVFIHHELGFVRKERLLGNMTLTAAERQMLQDAKAREFSDLEKYDAVITVTDVDKKILEKEGLSTPIYACNLAISTEPLPYSVKERQLTFVGGHGHFPNKEGIDWFVKEVAPLLKDEHLTLNLVGTHWPEEYSASTDINIDRKGFVEKLSTAAAGTIMVVPILSGSGMRMKILEAAAMSLPVVTTTVGVEGLDFTDGESCLIADSPKDFAKAIIRLGQEPEYRRMLGENAHKVYMNRYSAKVLANRRDEIYKKVTNPNYS